MAKSKTLYFCRNCGAESPKWIGRCPSCGEWNTYTEEPVSKSHGGTRARYKTEGGSSPVQVTAIEPSMESRLSSGSRETDRLLGGGLVGGSVILLGGEPGIGKSTLALQMALHLGNRKVLYVSGEESEQQIRLRADRLKGGNENCYILCETDIDTILEHATQLAPDLVIVDSVQTLTSMALESAAGSVTQVRECAATLLRYAKSTATPVIIIGHITKDGTLAGPKVLEHIVDVVLLFEGDSNFIYRILRATKNRFGSTAEIGIFEMLGTGLREVANPSELFITPHEEPLSGVAIAATIDGARPFMIETQALVSSAVYGTPQRSSTGFDTRRLNMLLAVLEKRAGFRLAMRDVFLNIAGGLKVSDPAIDLAVVAAVLSSNLDAPLPEGICFAGEVGLSGEIRPVPRPELRIREAEKLGFKSIVISKYQKNIDVSSGPEIIRASKIEGVVKRLFR